MTLDLILKATDYNHVLRDGSPLIELSFELCSIHEALFILEISTVFFGNVKNGMQNWTFYVLPLMKQNIKCEATEMSHVRVLIAQVLVTAG